MSALRWRRTKLGNFVAHGERGSYRLVPGIGSTWTILRYVGGGRWGTLVVGAASRAEARRLANETDSGARS